MAVPLIPQGKGEVNISVVDIHIQRNEIDYEEERIINRIKSMLNAGKEEYQIRMFVNETWDMRTRNFKKLLNKAQEI